MAPTKGCVQRLTREYKNLNKEPIPYCRAKPASGNICEWHFLIQGPPDTEFVGGEYHGKIEFPPTYPYAPPAIRFVTPNGRFTPNAKICFSFSDFHPEAWNPLWSVGTILNGILSFMSEEAATVGSIKATKQERKALAEASMDFNVKNAQFRSTFPEVVDEYKERRAAEVTQQLGGASLDESADGDLQRGSQDAAPCYSLRSNLPAVLIATLAICVLAYPYITRPSS